MTIRRRLACLIVALACVPGCGDDSPTAQDERTAGTDASLRDDPRPVPSPRDLAPLPEPLNPTTPRQKAEYALARLIRGPEPTQGLPVTHLHRTSLDLARRDLVSLPVLALELLADDALIQRVTSAHPNNQDPWHNILSVLAGIKAKPPALVARWTEPALGDRVFSTLRREAVRVLATDPHEDNAALTLRFLEVGAQDREIGVLTLRTLGRFGPTWQRRVAALLSAQGTPRLWTQLVAAFESGTAPAARTEDFSSMMFWWQAVTEGGGPRLIATLPRIKRLPWIKRRIYVDDDVHRYTHEGTRYPVAPFPYTSDGWVGLPLREAVTFPLPAFALNGESPAANARCALARLGYKPFVASVMADRMRPQHDPLQQSALHCMLPGEEQSTGQVVMSKLTTALADAIERPELLDPATFGRMINGLPSPRDPETRAVLIRILRELPAVAPARLITERASDRLAILGPEWIEILSELLASDDAVASARALRLMFRSGDADFLDAIEKHMATMPPEEAQGVYLRLVYLYASGNVEPSRRERFVRDMEQRLATASEARVRGLASALLDFGEAGVEAFARGLRGPRRRLYLAAWPTNTRTVDLLIARAAADPLNGRSDPSEIARVLNLAYQSFPESAVPVLEQLVRRMTGPPKAWTEVTLQRVRHRAFH